VFSSLRSLAVLILASALAAQEGAPRWIVSLAGRGFDLAPLRTAVRSGADAAKVRTIVADFEKRMRADQAEFLAFATGLGAKVTHQWWIVSACAVELRAEKLEALTAHPRVLRIDADERVGLAGPAPAPIKDATNANNHNSDAVNLLGILGQGVAIAILDAGQDEKVGTLTRPHSVYFVDGDPLNTTGGGLSGSRLLANFKVGQMPPDDLTGHGTGVAAVAAGAKWDKGTLSDAGHAPRAGIVGYSVADDAQGNSLYSTIVSAWQKVAADRATFNIVCANHSALGSPLPMHPSQQALDSAAWNADLLVTVAAANFGASSASSQSACNGLAVGATEKDTRKVAEFSSRGPLWGDAKRNYPDIVGNGVSIYMPDHDQESIASRYIASGTSFAAPQIGGAALLFRSVKTNATALETKAALLATTEDISGKNLAHPLATRNAYGSGYLRDDRLITLAQGQGLVVSDALTSPGQKKSHTLNVTSGRWYSAVVTWPRLDYQSAGWSDLALKAFAGATELSSSDSARNLYEKVVFQAPSSGQVRLEIEGKSLEAASVTCALAASEVPAPFEPGAIASYGQACAGSGFSYTIPAAAPAPRLSSFGNVSSDQPLGSDDHKLQIVYDQSAVPYALSANGIAFRHDDTTWDLSLPYSFELQVEVGTAAVLPAAISSSFATNLSGNLNQVVGFRRIAIEPPSAPNTKPSEWRFQVPFDHPFVWLPLPGKGLLVQLTHRASSPGFGDAYRVAADAMQDPAANPILSSLLGTSPTATTGTRLVGFGPVIGWMLLGTSGIAPLLAGDEPPRLGSNYTLELAQAASFGTGALLVGASDRFWGAIALPFDLTALGALGCSILASGETQVPFLLDGAGRKKLVLDVPPLSALVGGPLFHQALILDPASNSLGIAVSAGLRATIGGQR